VGEENPKQVQPPESDPDSVAGVRYQRSWLEAGIVPTLELVNHTTAPDHPGVAEILQFAEQYRSDRL